MSSREPEWESLDDDVQGFLPGQPIPCGIGKLLETLDKAATDYLLAALGNHAYTHMAIHKALIKRGYRMSYSTVQRHRNGTCSCEVEL